jgi:Mrp family chromosome partitioning ATPase
MVDLYTEMETLLRSLGRPSPRAGKVVQIVAAKPGEGTSTIARELAFAASAHSQRGVWLVELDVLSGEQHAVLGSDPNEYGVLGEATKASPDGSMFFAVDPPIKGVDGKPWPNARYLSAYPIGGRRFWVTRFRREALRAGQSVQILSKGDYWNTLRGFADYVIVDAPALDRSRAALAVARHMDSSVLVVAAGSADRTAPARAREAIEAAGGHCAGVVFNKAPEEPPAFVRRLLP